MNLYTISFFALNEIHRSANHRAEICIADNQDDALSKSRDGIYLMFPKDKGFYGHSVTVTPAKQPFLDFLKESLNKGLFTSNVLETGISREFEPTLIPDLFDNSSDGDGH